MTTQEVINKIFEENDDMTSYEEAIHLCMSEYARLKCLETARNTRYKAIEILHECFNHINWEDNLNLGFCERSIQNIRNQDVIPQL